MNNRFVLFALLAVTPYAHARVIDITSKAQFDREIRSGVTVVEFSQTTCPPCKAIAKDYTRLSNQFSGTTFLKLEIDTSDELGNLSDKYNVHHTPTIMIFKNGSMARSSNINSLADDLSSMLGKPAPAQETADESPGFIQRIIDTIKSWFGK